MMLTLRRPLAGMVMVPDVLKVRGAAPLTGVAGVAEKVMPTELGLRRERRRGPLGMELMLCSVTLEMERV